MIKIFMAVNRKCHVCNKNKLAHEHHKIAWVDDFPVYICSQICYKKYIEEWRDFQ